MDKNAIKKYAVWARTELITRVSQRAEKYDITAEADASASSVNGVLLSDAEIKQRKALIEQVKQKGFDQVMEEVAYTWFNRFIALRFMEVNGYLPSHIRVFTDENNNFKPQILAEAIHLELDGLDMGKVYEMKNNNENDDLYKYLIITQCNDLSKILPRMFQKIADFSELLFPDNILREGSVIEQMISTISEEDWKDQVQIIGWMYQYYIAEPKDVLINARTQYGDKDVPVVTQLFTSDWIVRFIVQNSLGKLWVNSHNNETDFNWEYYLSSNEKDESYLQKLMKVNEKYHSISPEELKCLDPCMGSGHILVYVFDVLMEIYETYGFTRRDAVKSIVSNNLYGLDIDERAAQLAYFSIMMKARQYDRQFFRSNIQPMVYAIPNSEDIDEGIIDFFSGGNSIIRRDLLHIIDAMKDGAEIGSLIRFENIDFGLLNNRLIELEQNGESSLYTYFVETKIRTMITVAQIMSAKFDVVVTNPPYMNWTYMPKKLKDYIQDNYSDYKSDLFSAFSKRVMEFTKTDGYIGLLMPYVWMFLMSYSKMREYINENASIVSLVQLEYNAFESATVPVAALTLCKNNIHASGEYIQLSDFKGIDVQAPKTLEAVKNKNCGYRYTTYQSSFEKIPGMPFAYWLSDTLYSLFGSSKTIGDYGEPKKGLSTGENNRFLRMWHEVDINKCGIGLSSYEEPYKWIPLNKGGDYRKWYGNNTYMINWEHNGAEIKNFKGSVIRNEKYYFKKSLTWTMLSSSCLGIRASEQGKIFEGAGPSLFVADEYYYYIMGLLCSKLGLMIINIFNPTMNININDIANIPLKIDENYKTEVESIVRDSIAIAKEDWDAYENSWDFVKHPLIKNVPTIKEAFQLWSSECNSRFSKLKRNEERLNEIFIDIYGLKGSVSPNVDDKDITLNMANEREDVCSLISYGVGCILGRYSLDKNGIVYAGGKWDEQKYLSNSVDKDGIIPITDDEYFDDDIVNKFSDFIKNAYGEEHLEENLNYIASVLGGDGTSRSIIRDYFISEFYQNHIKTYQKRPIYWLFDSGRKNGFKCLIYMHRYQPDTLARIRTDYVHELQARYRTAIEDIERKIMGASSSEKVKMNKKLKKLKDQSEEIQKFEEKVHHIADQMISINLDDGVKTNYEIFKDVVVKIK